MANGREPKIRHMVLPHPTYGAVVPPSCTNLAMVESQKSATDICHGRYLITLNTNEVLMWFSLLYPLVLITLFPILLISLSQTINEAQSCEVTYSFSFPYILEQLVTYILDGGSN